eukprot:175829-Pyramimonas_sp.AAC.3
MPSSFVSKESHFAVANSSAHQSVHPVASGPRSRPFGYDTGRFCRDGTHRQIEGTNIASDQGAFGRSQHTRVLTLENRGPDAYPRFVTVSPVELSERLHFISKAWLRTPMHRSYSSLRYRKGLPV